MTGFARAEARGEWGSVTWELRTVNARFLDIFLRLPEDLRGIEPQLRDAAKQRLERGKLDCTLRVEGGEGPATALGINRALADRLVSACGELVASAPALTPPSAMDILRWPGVVEHTPPDLEALGEAALAAYREALEELAAAREREGARLHTLLAERLAQMSTIIAGLRERTPELLGAARERLRNRLAELGAELDPARLEQEITVVAQKSDVAEELDRLEAHVAEVRRQLEAQGAVGRRLDFLVQEMGRESNTLASKSTDTSLTRAAVDLKVLVEQLREQVQNIE